METILDKERSQKTTTTVEKINLQQQSLIAIKLLSVQLATDNPSAFRPILDSLSKIIKCGDDIHIHILAQSILCLAKICANLRAHAISYLSKFMPALGKILQKQVQTVKTTPNIILPIVTSILIIVETLPLFLSPYLVNIIVSLSQIWSGLLQLPASDDIQKKLVTLDQIWKQLANVLTLRVLVPMIDQSYNKLVADNECAAVGPLMKLLTVRLLNLTGTEIVPFQNELASFFIDALQFRSDNMERLGDRLVVDNLEKHVIEAFVSYALKMSESSFRPLYYKVYDWALRDSSDSVHRAITFYK